MRPLSSAILICATLLCAGGAAAQSSPWRTMALPPESERLTREGDNAESQATAARAYARAIGLCPSNGPALFGLGGILLRQNRPLDSLKVFRRMNLFFPGDPEIAVAMAVTLTRLPDLTRTRLHDGIDQLEQVLKLHPDDTEAWYQLSILRHLDGDYTRAAEAAREAIALDAAAPLDLETTTRYQQQEIACNDALSVFSPLD